MRLTLRALACLAVLLPSPAVAQAQLPTLRPSSPGDAPIVILATGQSNFVHRYEFSWRPASNAQKWNWDGVDGHVGSIFEAIPGDSINVTERFASEIALANPTRPVYVINISIGSQSIDQWKAGASAPDMYANITANIVPALARIGVSRIDGLAWWHGESQNAGPENYVSDFNTVMNRFRGEKWFPRSTPVIVFGIAPKAISGTFATDVINASLQEVVRAEPNLRRFVYTGVFGASHWADRLHPNGQGFAAIGATAANAYLYGHTHLTMPNTAAGRNLVKGGDFTVYPWRRGSSFSRVAGGTTVLDNWTWVQSGAGVVDIKRTADAPTMAQSGHQTRHSLHVDVRKADASIGKADFGKLDYYGLRYDVKGADGSLLRFGNTRARPVVVSFWVKATVTGNYFVALENSSNNRSYNSRYTVNKTNRWEFKRVAIDGDTAGTWLYGMSEVALRVYFSLASSDTYLFTPDVWNATDARVGNPTRANGLSSAANDFKLALVRIEEAVLPSAALDPMPPGEDTISIACVAPVTGEPRQAGKRSRIDGPKCRRATGSAFPMIIEPAPYVPAARRASGDR